MRRGLLSQTEAHRVPVSWCGDWRGGAQDVAAQGTTIIFIMFQIVFYT